MLGVLLVVGYFIWQYLRGNIAKLESKLDEATTELKQCQQNRMDMLKEYERQIADLKSHIAELKNYYC